MATVTWTGNAAAVKQINTITVANTWATNDTATLTMNGKDLVVTIGADTSTTQVAQAIRDAWNASSRLDSEGTTDATSNFGGQEFGEYSEATASIDPDSLSVVLITANKAGVPFTLTVTESTAGTGTATGATSQTATGAWHWDNGDNWDGGSAPANDDVVIFRDSAVSCKYGLPNASKEVTLYVHQSFTGTIGLPEYNTEQPTKPFKEYRQRYAKFDEAGSGSALTHVFGIGEGNGSPMINVWFVTSTLTTSANVYNTGTPQSNMGPRALNILIDNGVGGGGTLTVLKGSVYSGEQFGSKPSFATINIGYTNAAANDVDLYCRNHNASVTINQSGGTLLFVEDTTLGGSANRSLTAYGGRSTWRDIQTGGTMTFVVYDSTIVYNSTKTLGSCTLGNKGVLDLEKDMRAVTISVLDMFAGASLLDEFARGTYSAGVDLNRCGIDDVTIRLGNNRRLTPGTAA